MTLTFLKVVSRSCEPLCYIRRWISRKLSDIEGWFQRNTNRKWPTGIKCSRDRWRHVTLRGQTRDPNTFRAQYLESSWRCSFATNANYKLISLRWDNTVGYTSDSLTSCWHYNKFSFMEFVLRPNLLQRFRTPLYITSVKIVLRTQNQTLMSRWVHWIVACQNQPLKSPLSFVTLTQQSGDFSGILAIRH